MKRKPKPFSVEIKKSRVQGQRDQLTPRRLFELLPVRAAMIFQEEEPQVVAKPSAAPRILPSIVESVLSNSDPIQPIRYKRSSAKVTRGHMELNLNAGASEDMEDGPAEVPMAAKAVLQTDGARDDAEVALSVQDVQSVQSGSMSAGSPKPRKKTFGTVEQGTAPEPIPEAELTASAASTKATQRRLTKRLAAVAQLPRHERWKGRLHPAAW
jgi:hypothetical protein